MPAEDLIQLRRGTAAEWTAANPVLAAGEPGIEQPAVSGDPPRIKIGDGVTHWNEMAYAPASALVVKDEGVAVGASADTLDFVGTGVTVSDNGGTKSITIIGNSALHLEDFGGGGDAIDVSDAVINSGSPIVTSASAPFTPAMVGKVAVVGAATSSGAGRLKTTVLSVQSANQITLANSPTVSQAATGLMVGTDNGPALQLALASAATRSSAGARRHIQFREGKYLFASPASQNFLNVVETLTISGTGRSTQILIAGTPTMDICVAQNLDQFFFQQCLIVGLFNQMVDCASVVYAQYVRQFTARDLWWYGVGSGGGAPASGLIHTYECDTRLEDMIFHGCAGAESANGCAVFTRNWQGFLGRRLQFIDYGNYEGTLFTSSRCKAWIRAQDPHPVGGADGQGEFTLEHFRMDEGTQHSIQMVASGTRTENVRLRDGTVFAGLTHSFAAIDLASTSNVEIDAVKVGLRSGSISDALKLTDAGNVTIKRSRFYDSANRISVDALTKHLRIEDTTYGSVLGEPLLLTESQDGTERRAERSSPRLLSFLPTAVLPSSNTNWGRVSTAQLVGGATLDSTGTPFAQAVWDEIVLGAGEWKMDLTYRGHVNRGIVTFALDDGKGMFLDFGTIDLYAAIDAPNSSGTIPGIVVASSIRRSLRLRIESKRAASSGYFGSIQAITFRRTA